MSDKHLVAVYGSLKKGYHNHDILRRYNGNYMGDCYLGGWLMISLQAYPAILPSSNKTDTVRVEVYEVSKVCLDAMDVLEGIRNKHYERVSVQTRFGRAEVYQYHSDSFLHMTSGLQPIALVHSGEWTRSARTRAYGADVLLGMLTKSYVNRMMDSEDMSEDELTPYIDVEAIADEVAEATVDPVGDGTVEEDEDEPEFWELEYEPAQQEEITNAAVSEPTV